MYAKVFALAALATVAVAAPASQCNVGQVQCCNSVQTADSHAVQGIAANNALVAAALAAAPVDALVGLTCNPISVIGVGGNSCSAQPVCCSNNNFNGLVAIGCSPVNVNL